MRLAVLRRPRGDGCFFRAGQLRLQYFRDLGRDLGFDRKDVSQFPINLSAQSWESFCALISCTFTRT